MVPRRAPSSTSASDPNRNISNAPPPDPTSPHPSFPHAPSAPHRPLGSEGARRVTCGLRTDHQRPTATGRMSPRAPEPTARGANTDADNRLSCGPFFSVAMRYQKPCDTHRRARSRSSRAHSNNTTLASAHRAARQGHPAFARRVVQHGWCTLVEVWGLCASLAECTVDGRRGRSIT